MKKETFDYNWGDDLVKFNSLSPNDKFYYRIGKPVDKYWGLYVAKIAFFDADGQLVYHNQNAFADPIQQTQNDSIKYATYSKDGNLAYMRERGQDIKQLHHLLIDLRKGKYKILPWSESDYRDGFKIFEEDSFEADLAHKFNHSAWIMNQHDKTEILPFIKLKKWFPEI
ncbi:hypothetical protein GXP67_06310 [Rhodocytophaga rosea]|uniref:Uncharacterized protein n=1 Tax=Rhodocytophaga rosea TaxID=2704465 RepID=A0A6C0GEC3_9BACT|nr:hypothetical protein [Rhodocytophaga rosea]QHT66298.1 hypothetical protein GXP67_06310 [Rhodocytophaga rosea]